MHTHLFLISLDCQGAGSHHLTWASARVAVCLVFYRIYCEMSMSTSVTLQEKDPLLYEVGPP